MHEKIGEILLTIKNVDGKKTLQNEHIFYYT